MLRCKIERGILPSGALPADRNIAPQDDFAGTLDPPILRSGQFASGRELRLVPGAFRLIPEALPEPDALVPPPAAGPASAARFPPAMIVREKPNLFSIFFIVRRGSGSILPRILPQMLLVMTLSSVVVYGHRHAPDWVPS